MDSLTLLAALLDLQNIIESSAALDPNQLSLFDSVPATGQSEDIREEDSSAAVPSKAKPDGKKKESRRNRELLEGLPVVEVVIEPDRVDLDRYRRICEERTRTLEFEPGRQAVCKGDCLSQIWTERQLESSQGR